MKYTHVVFDVDGTLIDSEKAVLLALQKTLSEVEGKIYPLEKLQFSFGIPGEDALKQLNVKDIDYCNQICNEREADYSYTTKLFDGIQSTLSKLQAQGVSLGIITSRTKEEFQNGFAPFGIADFFDLVVCAEDTAEHKPSAEPMLKYLELADAQKKDVLFIGDSIYDWKCAKGAGVDFGLALWGCLSSEGIYPTAALEKPESILDL